MKFDKLLISLAIFAFSINPIHAMDILGPSQLGESMGMPLPQDLLQKGISAGIIKSASQVTESLPSESSGVNPGMPVTASDPLGDSDTQQMSGNELNISGALSLILQDKAVNYLNLVLHQSDASVLGQGNMISGNSIQNVTVSGLVKDGKVSLTIAPDGSSGLYGLELQPEGNMLKGSYDIHSTDGATRSGTAIGILSNDAVKLQSPHDLPPKSSAIAAGATKPLSSTTAGSGPHQLGRGSSIGSTFSSSKSISMSTSSGGSMVSSTSSTSS